MHFHRAAYCILNLFNLPRSLETPRLQELQVLPPPLAHIRLLSRFCSPKPQMQDRAMLSCKAQGAEWPSQGPGTLWGPLWAPSPSVAKHRDAGSVLPLQSCSSPGTSCTLAQHPGAGAAVWDQQLLPPGSGGVCSLTQPSCARERPLPWACRHLPLGTALPDLPAARIPSGHRFPRCPALPGGRAGSSGLVVSAGTCCPRRCRAQSAHPSSQSLMDPRAGLCKGQRIRFSVPSVGRERWKMDVLFLQLV